MAAAVAEPPRASPTQQLTTSRRGEEVALVQQALAWLQDLGLVVDHEACDPEDNAGLSSLFADCWLLGRLAELLQALRQGGGAASSRGPPRSPLPPPGTHQPRPFRDRIQDYTRWQQLCRDMGVRSDLIPLLADLEQGSAAVAACLWELANKCAAQGLPVPPFDARSSLRRSMSRMASARRAERFVREGSSPPKLPAMLLVTPRAYACKNGSPAGLAGASTLRDSNGSLREWLHSGGSRRKVQPPPEGWEAAHQQQAGEEGWDASGSGSGDAGLGRTIAALERAAAEAAAGRHSSSPAAGQQAGAAAQKPWRRPALPRLDVEAAVAQAAAEAAEEEEAGEGEYAASPDGLISPLSSPTSSLGSPSLGDYSSASQLSSGQSSPEAPHRRCASGSGSPRRHMMTPSHLQHSGFNNPLWSQSPQAQPAPAAATGAASLTPPVGQHPSAAGDVGAASASRWRSSSPVVCLSPEQAHTPMSTSRSRSEQAAEPGCRPSPSPAEQHPRSAGSGAPRWLVRRSLDEDSPGDNGGLLESLLSPPLLKPAHTRLLGALMHTATPAASSASARQAGGLGLLLEQGPEEEEEAEEEREEEEEAAAEAAAAAAALARAEPPVLVADSRPSTTAQPALAAATPAASAATPAVPQGGSNAGSSLVRRLALLALGAAVGAAAALTASTLQGERGRGGSRRRRRLSTPPLRPPQPVPPLHTGEQKVHYDQGAGQQQGTTVRRSSGSGSSSGGSSSTSASTGAPTSLQAGATGASRAPATQAPPVSWDNPHALLTRG